MEDSSKGIMALFRPPIVRSANAALDRSLFTKKFPIAAARVLDNKNISKYRTQLERSRDILKLERLGAVRSDPDANLASKGGRCLLLQPDVKTGAPETWSPILQEAVKAEELRLVDYELVLDYDYWTYYDVITSILPEDAQEEIPVGFAIVGHVAHLNLKEDYLPYKNVIAQIIVDKNAAVKTVINKINDVGTHSEYRTFDYEVLAGEDDMNVEVHEGECTFKFDYSKVYWNTRLQTEHKRLVDSFSAGEVVCDVMAGVGPFACPAGKKGVFVWANDLNPDSYASLKDAISRNKLTNFVRPFNSDGHAFIRFAADDLLSLAASGANTITLPVKPPRHRHGVPLPPPAPAPPKTLTIPSTISHFVMNLPASALSFLPSFAGLYAGREALFAPHTQTKLPMVHAHCFSTKSEDNVREAREIAARIAEELRCDMRPGDGAVEGQVEVYEVRDVAPKKRMFCASFRLPAEVAFRKRDGGSASG